MSIENLETAKGGPFVVRHDGVEHVLADPATLDFQKVLVCLQGGLAPGMPACKDWQRRLIARAWAAHHDLPDLQSAQRLCYSADRYTSALVADIHRWYHLDFGELWRSRRWRTLLDLIDRLPGHSWYAVAVNDDEEHTRMLAESMARQRTEEGEPEPKGPGLQSWTPEVAAITTLTDAVRENTYVLQAVNGNKPSLPTPLPRPQSALDAAVRRAEHNLREARHQSIVARLLPDKAR